MEYEISQEYTALFPPNNTKVQHLIIDFYLICETLFIYFTQYYCKHQTKGVIAYFETQLKLCKTTIFCTKNL